MKKVLVTGANGFIGRYLVERLKKDGIEVIAHKHDDGDLLKSGALDQYDVVEATIHLAGKTYVPASWENPAEFINQNNLMLTNVLEFCRKQKSKFIFISTYLYGEPEYLPVDENHKCVTPTPYHLSKKIGEEICEFYSKNFNVDAAVVRPFNVYGRGQNKEFLLPKVYYQVADKSLEQVEVFDLAPKRDYVYVEDVVDVLVKLLDHINGFDIFNVGSGRSYSVMDAISIIQKELGTTKKVTERNNNRKNEIMDCVADISHLESVIGRVSVTPIEQGIHKWHLLDIGE